MDERYNKTKAFDEACEKLKEEFNKLASQHENLKEDYGKIQCERDQLAKFYGFYHELTCALNTELHKYIDCFEKINVVCRGILPYLSKDQKTSLSGMLDYLQQMTSNETQKKLINMSKETKYNVLPSADNNNNNYNVTKDHMQSENDQSPSSKHGSMKQRSKESFSKHKSISTDQQNKLHSESVKRPQPDSLSSSYRLASTEQSQMTRDSFPIPEHLVYPQYHDSYYGFPPINAYPPPHFQPMEMGLPPFPINQDVGPSFKPRYFAPMMPSLHHHHMPVLNMDHSHQGVAMPSKFHRVGQPRAPPPQMISPELNSPKRSISSRTMRSGSEAKKFKEDEYISSFNDNIPKYLKKAFSLSHGVVVCAVTMGLENLAVTGGKGVLKLWDLNTPEAEPVGSLKCLDGKYIRSCKINKENCSVIVSGESSVITVWDIANCKKIQSLQACEIPDDTMSCYALDISSDGRLCYGGCSNGRTVVWDLNSSKVVKEFPGHKDSVTCLQLSTDNETLYTGSLDKTAKIWDIREDAVKDVHDFGSQVFAIASDPKQEWICAGLENSAIDFVTKQKRKYSLKLHNESVLSIKVEPDGEWMISVGKDRILNCIKTPFGPPAIDIIEELSILCCDISSDKKYVLVGTSGHDAIVYNVVF